MHAFQNVCKPNILKNTYAIAALILDLIFLELILISIHSWNEKAGLYNSRAHYPH